MLVLPPTGWVSGPKLVKNKRNLHSTGVKVLILVLINYLADPELVKSE